MVTANENTVMLCHERCGLRLDGRANRLQWRSIGQPHIAPIAEPT